MTPPPTPAGHDAEVREALEPTPSTDEIRYRVDHDWEPYGDGSFDRWLTAHVAAVVAEKTAEIERLTREVEVKYLNAIGFKNERDAYWAELAEKTAEVERLRQYIDGWKGENARIARQRDAQVEKTIRAWTDRDQALGVVAAVKALVDRYDVAEQDDVRFLGDELADAIRAVLEPVSGAVEGAGQQEPVADVDPARYWREIAERNASERDGWRDAFTSLTEGSLSTPVAEHEQEVRAEEAHHGHETWAWNCVLPDADRPNGDHRDESVTCVPCAARTPEAGS